MAAGNEVISNDVVRKVEIEEKCDLNRVSDVATVDGNVGGNGNINGNGKEDSDDSSYVFVSDGVEVTADDTGGDNVVAKPDSVDEVEKVKKEELDIENREVIVDPVVLENNGVVHESVTVTDAGVKGVNDDLDLENGSSVDSSEVMETDVIVEDVNGHPDKIKGEDVEVVESTEEVPDANGIANGEVKADKIISEVVESTEEVPDDSESTLNLVENSQERAFELESTTKTSEESKSEVTVTQSVSTADVTDTTDNLESTLKPSEESRSQVTITESVSTPVLIDTTDELPSTENSLSYTNCEVIDTSSTVIDNTGCEVTVDESDKPLGNLECQVTTNGQVSFVSPIKEQEDQVTNDESGKLSEDLESQVTGDVPESCESPIEQECKVAVDGLESIDSLVDNQECPVLVGEPEHSGNHSEKVDYTTIVKVTDDKSEEHRELFNMNSEVNVEAKPNHICNGIKAKHESESLSTPYPAKNKKAERTEIGLGTESEVNPESGIVLSEEADVLANGPVEKFDGILQTGEPQVSETEADGSVPSEKAKLEEMHEKEVEGSPETLIKSSESVEIVENFKETREQVKIDDEIEESEIVFTNTVQDDLNLEDNTAESVNEAEVPLEVETNVGLITPENTSSQYEISNVIDKTEEVFQPEESAENVESLPSIDPVPIESKNIDLLVEKDNCSHSNPDDLTVVEQEVKAVVNLVTENRSAETGTEIVDVFDDEEKENEVKDAPVEFVAHMVTDNMAAEVPTEAMNCETQIENVDVQDDEEKETEVVSAPVGEHSTLSFPESYVNPGAVIEFGSIGRHETTPSIHNDDDDVIFVPVVANENTKPSWGEESDNIEQNVDGSLGEKSSNKMSCPEVEDIDGTQSDEIPTLSVEGSVTDAIDVQNEETEALAYNFLIRIPRFEDESYTDQIRSAQLLVEEKTRIRDAIRVDIHGKRARLRAHNESYNAAKLEETAARRLVRLKRQEIDSVQIVINRWKNAMSVEDIDSRILNTEHMIQHETLDLKDEKQFIREIKQLKTLRDQLASNMGTKEEVQQAIAQKDQTEEHMKSLRKELDSLKDKVSKAEAVVKAVGKKYDEENRKERELQAQFRVADEVRQKAYAHLNSLKKLSYDKNKNFRLYKEDLMAARDFVSHGDKDALHRLCANQVETFMEQWNNNDEFRKEYVSRCNMNASRRQRAFEGNSIIPDGVAPVLPSNANESVGRSLVSIPVEAKTASVVSAGEEGKIVLCIQNKHADDNNNNNDNNKSIENLSGQKNPILKTKGPAKPIARSDVPMVTESTVATEVIVKKEEDNTETKEEIELAKKDEELKKAETEAKLKEQRRLEEKAKALEALERKKRNADKAQLKAELRARKEAEQKEKEREKRLRKKEKKANGGDGSINGEETANSEIPTEATTKEIEPVKENIKKKTQKPPAHFFSKQLKPKPIPPPLVNRNKKRWQQYGKFVAAALAILAVFFIGNTSLFTNLKATKFFGRA